MALDYLLWTNDSTTFASKYLKVPIQAATYFVNHYKVRAAHPCQWLFPFPSSSCAALLRVPPLPPPPPPPPPSFPHPTPRLPS
jgi:hypothetical protein